ncbi:hypothetical protein MPDQ_006646 [Monascus purpureus]|uniref:Uncharacterized protein n=1 Tax=Monascus purpureus TaxID=5098 RepID=A0A507R5V4_MONPU|nr:hypothetical protein MPDQ_006646 [Monascus purpureus]BDD60629.1 hypothetical protein MAP00_005736 [Monascus purpureus]
MAETLRPVFSDRLHPKLSYGIPFPAAAAHHVTATFHASRVYVLCSGSLERNSHVLERLTSALGADRVVGKRIGMKSHTLWSEVVEVVNDARREQADLLMTLGAGSLTDAAKIAALALANDVQDISDLSTLCEGPRKRSIINPPIVPIISIPTSLSAGEYSNFAGGTDSTGQKRSFSSPTRGPQLVILDPDLASTTPDRIWLSTGVRAVDHCVEALCSVDGPTKESDDTSEQALGLLLPGLLRCAGDPNRKDKEARLQCQIGSANAMTAATSGVQLGASHGIGHQLGPLGVGHGETSCILLPSVCRYNLVHDDARGTNRARQERVLRFLESNAVVAGVLRSRSVDVQKADLAVVLDAVIRELGMPRTLKDVGVYLNQEQLEGLAAKSLQDRWCLTNPVPLKEKDQVLEILRTVLE